MTPMALAWALGLALVAMLPDCCVESVNLFDENHPFAFYMFENFKLCREVFVREAEFLQDLKETKGRLEAKLERMRALKKSHKLQVEASINGVQDAESLVQGMAENFRKSTFDFPNVTDMSGAINGMVLLYDTYKFDIEAALNGTLLIDSFPSGQAVNMKSRERLVPSDLANFAKHAFKKTWYDTAIPFVKTLFDVLPREPKHLRPTKADFKDLIKMRKDLVHLNNQWLLKKMTLADNNFKVLPYVVDDKLQIKPKQPRILREQSILFSKLDTQQGKEHLFRSVCNGFSFRAQSGIVYVHKCGLLHHDDPYLKLGPYKVEVASQSPYIVVFHELFTATEMDFLVETSLPNLSRKRHVDHNNEGAKYEFKSKSGKKRRIIHKTVQHWLDDVVFESVTHNLDEYETDFHYTIVSPILHKLSQRLEIATRLNVTAKYASTQYQTTNYGLGGLCETHIDPHGYLEGAELGESRASLVKSGDMLATVMGWIADEPVGGATAFVHPFREVTVWPTKGAAAFWFSLDKKGHRDKHSNHGGCPVLYGSKWIVNKWIYYFDSWQNFPCGLNPQEYISGFTGFY